MEQLRSLVEVITQRIGDGLRLIVIIHAREIEPTWVASDFNQARTQHDSADEKPH